VLQAAKMAPRVKIADQPAMDFMKMFSARNIPQAAKTYAGLS
jgi:hypothetical protein